MTLSAGSNPEDNDDKAAGGAGKDASGRSLEPSRAGGKDDADLAPFLSAAGERIEIPPGPRPFHAKLLDYSAHAAMIAGLLGFAWTVSDHVAKSSATPPAPAKVVSAAPAPQAPDTTAELRRSTQKLAADVSALRLSLEGLRSQMHQDKTAEQVRALAASLDGVKSGLSATKSETSATLAQLSSKIDHLPHSEQAAKIQQIIERLDKMEREVADKTTTASIAPADKVKATPIALPPSKPQQIAKAQPEALDAAKKAALDKAVLEGDGAKKPPVIAEWVVRDVYDGAAIVESKRGPMEVVPGTPIPGAGVVKSIERHGSGWTVTTTKGVIAYLAPQRQRVLHGYYRTMPDDF